VIRLKPSVRSRCHPCDRLWWSAVGRRLGWGVVVVVVVGGRERGGAGVARWCVQAMHGANVCTVLSLVQEELERRLRDNMAQMAGLESRLRGRC
jgi:hypothetical protein